MSVCMRCSAVFPRAIVGADGRDACPHCYEALSHNGAHAERYRAKFNEYRDKFHEAHARVWEEDFT